MKFAVIVFAFALSTFVAAQNQNMNPLPFPFNAIQMPQIVPAPFCLCGVLPRLKLLEKEECMKNSFCNNMVQPVQDDICNRYPQPNPPPPPPAFNPPTFAPPPFRPPMMCPSPPQFTPIRCEECNLPVCCKNHYC